MALDLGQLKITKWIAHDVPRVRKADVATAALDLSEVAAPTHPRVAEFLRMRVNHALAARKVDIVEMTGMTSPVPTAVKNLLHGRGQLVATSQLFARHLRACQTGATSAGLLIVANIDVGSDRGIALLKLEPQDGAQAVRTMINGKVTYDVTVLDDLVLTKGTRVFKVALFVGGDINGGILSGRMADPQNGSGADDDPADFFLRQFLGCQLTETPEVTTRRFLDTAERYANERISDPRRRAEFTVALHAELRSNRTSLSVKQFASDTLAADDRKEFLDFMNEAEVPVQTFTKAPDAVTKHLAKVAFSFDDGTMVVTTTASLDEGIVTVEPAGGDKTQLQVLEHLNRIGKRAR